ncbi:DUF6934 family protein [Dyadobacter jiangsuensis]
MNEESYPFTAAHGPFLYLFESVSPNKKIQKAVLFTGFQGNSIFNLALLDVNEHGLLDGEVESNNGDLVTVLATVFRITEHFLVNNPGSMVMFRGSEKRRHRLYRILLSRELHSISKKFGVYGGVPGNFDPFEPDTNYDFYFIKQQEI